MNTECAADQLEFHGLGRRVVMGLALGYEDLNDHDTL